MGEVGQLSPLKVNVKFFHSFFLYLKLISVIYFYFGTHLLVFFCIFFLCHNTTDSCKHCLTIPVDVYFLSRAYMTPHSAPDCLYIV